MAHADPGRASVDVVVIGAGFAGLYMLHKLRDLGLDAVVLEAGDGVGGTWYWNRYPGARVDLQSIEYSYSFSDELQQKWKWSELFATQPELEAYLNWVADQLDLRRDIRLATRVLSLVYDESNLAWSVETSTGARYECTFVVAATGCLSAPIKPDISGLESFQGPVLYTSSFPKDGFDFSGKRVGLVGTGSSGVQTAPSIADECEHLFIFQRSAGFTRTEESRPYRTGEFEALQAQYDSIRAREREAHAGVIFGGALAASEPPTRKILEASIEERLAAVDDRGWHAPVAWADVLVDPEANRAGVELYAELLRRAVVDADTAASLVPRYPVGCKRWIVEVGYYDTLNRSNVTLVDLRKGALRNVTATGVATEQGEFEVDVLVLATGFDALTGALTRIDVRGRDGRSLREYWAEEGPVSYLGLQTPGFPNLFTITGPGSPSVLANLVLAIEQHVEWIGDCLKFLRTNGLHQIEATESAARQWTEAVREAAEGSMKTAESCSSWYLGSNVPGKKRAILVYLGGLPRYRSICDDVAAAGYRGFVTA